MRYTEKNQKINNAIKIANQGKYNEAISSLVLLSNEFPDNNFLLVNLASLYFVTNNLDDVEVVLDTFLLSKEQEFSEFYLVASDLYIRSACFSKSVACMQQAIKYFPDDESVCGLLAQTSYESRDSEGAIDAVKKVIEISPQNYDAKVLLANLLSGKGNFEQSEKLINEVLNVAPWHSVACSVLSKCKKHEGSEGLKVLESFNTALNERDRSPQVDPECKARIHYAMAKVHNDNKNYSAAWQSATRANKIKFELSPFDGEEYSRFIDSLIEQFSDNSFEKTKTSDGPDPIFIVGMPRSGTTLTEQILSLDQSIYPGGEKRGLDYALLMVFKGKDYLKAISEATQADFKPLADRYYRYYSNFCNFSGSRIVNKVPANYLHLGIFKMMYPNLKVINMQRNPMDVAVSIYFEHFSARLNYTNRVEDIILVYNEYKKLMKFWSSKFSENIINIDYHNMTEDYELNKQRIIDFCGLEIKQTSDFSKSENFVETPSVWQVRQGIYQSSVERWKRYEEQLSPYLQLLTG